MNLNNLPKTNQIRKAKRLGRGFGSGKGGHTVGRGAKGQKARNTIPFGFEGGQIPLYKRLPFYGGFKNPTKKDVIAISMQDLNVFKEGTEVTVDKLLEKGIISRKPKHFVKVLANGKIEKKLTLKGLKVSKSVEAAIKKAGGKLS
jgi:large subunit ribosomal protein L15